MVFIFAAIARQEFHTFFTVSQTSSITPGDDSDFSKKLGAMCHFFDKRGYPFSVVQAGYHRAKQIHRKSATKTAEKENTDRIPFTLTFHLRNYRVKTIILKNFKSIHFVYVVTTLIFRKNQS